VTWALVVAALVLLERRVATVRLGLGVALRMLLAGLTLLVAKDLLMSPLAGQPISGAAEAALGAVLSSLAQFMLIVLVVAAAVVETSPRTSSKALSATTCVPPDADGLPAQVACTPLSGSIPLALRPSAG
jgi:hypothetical protein